MAPVSGTVTFDGGAPPAPGTIIFKPLEVAVGAPRRSGRARFGVDGQFTVTSFRESDGLYPGQYEVEITCYSDSPRIGSKDPFGDVSYIAKDYQPENLQVNSDGDPITINYDVPLKK